MEQIEIDFQKELKEKFKRQQNGYWTIMHGVKKIVFGNSTDEEDIVKVFKEFYPFEYGEMFNAYQFKKEQEAWAKEEDEKKEE